MSKLRNTNYYKWTIREGDYNRDQEATIEHVKKINSKKRIKLSFIILVYVIAITAAAYVLTLLLKL